MTQPSGWYDDPQDPSQFRYWDGVVWSDHVTPKVSPTVEQSNICMPYGVSPAATRPEGSGSHGAQGPPMAPGGFGPPQQDQAQGQQGGQWPAYGQDPGYLAAQQGWQSHLRATTPDGAVLSGWWKRVAARIIDFILVLVVTLPLTFVALRRVGALFGDFSDRVMAAARAGGSTASVERDAERIATEMFVPMVEVSLVLLAVLLVYEVALLTTTGATLGQRMMGISVRLRDKPGPAPLLAVVKRTAVKEWGWLVWLLPVLGLFGLLFILLDSLWPLWDNKKQAIHDKAGATNVVVGPQPKRDP